MDHSSRSTTAPANATRMVDVLVPVALDQTYSYKVPRGLKGPPRAPTKIGPSAGSG